MRSGRRLFPAGILIGSACVASAAFAQSTPARTLLEQAAAAMGGLERLQSLDNVVLTGFGEYLNQSGGGNPSPDPRAPAKLTVAHDVERVFDLAERARGQSRAHRLAVSVRDRAALGPQRSSAERSSDARPSAAGVARGARSRDTPRPGAHGGWPHCRRVHDSAGRHALACAGSR